MSIHTYAQWARALANEVLSEFSEDEIERLRKISWDDYVTFYTENSVRISELAKKSPSQRCKLNDWKRPDMRLAVYHFYIGASRVLDVSGFCEDLQGLSYRDASRSAGKAYLDLLSQPVFDWPWWGDNPFDRGQ